MQNMRRRGLMGLLAALPLAAAAPAVVPTAGRLRVGEALLMGIGEIRLPPLTPSQVAALEASWAEASMLPGWMPTLEPGERFHPIRPAPADLAPPGWDTLENVR